MITHDGVHLAVRDYEPASPAEHTVVLLHGFCLTQASWNIQIRQLRRRWGDSIRIIAYDHRGHGRSTSAPIRTYSIDQLAADLAEILTSLHVTGPTTLAGHSMGGMTAIAYLARPARLQPVRPCGLILVASAAGRLAQRGIGRLLATPGLAALVGVVDRAPHHAAEQAVRALIRPVCAALTRHGFGTSERDALTLVAADTVHNTPLTTAVGFLCALKDYDQYPTLRSITATTVVISGGTDVLTPPAHASDLAAGIPNATHLHRPNAGHMLLHEAPRTVTSAITRSIQLAATATCVEPLLEIAGVPA